MPATVDLAALRRLAVRASQAGAEVLAERAQRWRALDADLKGRGDYVTEVDRAAEAACVAVLRAGAPRIDVLAEEGGGERSALHWAVDPLDGTTNFLRGFPVVGVSVGLIEEGAPVVGAVSAPLLAGAGWSAARGLGAHDAAGRRLSVRPPGSQAVVATGFPFRRPSNLPRYQGALDAALRSFEDLRRAGAASLDLAYTAQGSFDGYFELGLSLWDVAAGAVLVREAGGVVTDWRGDPGGFLESGDIIAGAPAWHERMLELVRRAGSADG